MSTKHEQLSLEILKQLSPFNAGRDLVSDAARDLFLNCVKTEPCVHDVFFDHVTKDDKYEEIEMRLFPFAKFAIAFLAQTLISIKDGYKFHAMLNKDKVARTVGACYDSMDWKKIGFHLYTLLYPTVVCDPDTHVSLQDFIDDEGHIWADQLIDDIKDPNWTKQMLVKFVRGKYTEKEYNRDMNDLFVKLHLLDPQSVLPAYQFLFSDKALPEVHLELATRNYLGGPFKCDVISEEVKQMMDKASNPLNSSMLSLNTIELFYGIEVDEFILTECRNMGLWSGRRPDNKRLSSFRDRCIIS